MADKAEIAAKKIDATDYAQRSRSNLLAGVGILVLLAIGGYAAKLFFDQEKLQNCISSGRRNCVEIKAPPREGVFIPSH